VLVSVQAEGAAVVVVIEDDGVGLRSGAAARGGLGLIGIQERVQELDGKLQISSEIRKGTRIRVQLPVEAA
jgi:signal transduction histidine kinase